MALPEKIPGPGPTSLAEEAEPAAGAGAPYLNRELSWLEFNRRVLAEAADARRTRSSSGSSSSPSSDSNLDEFFMKRVGGLKQQIAGHIRETCRPTG